MFDGRFDQHFAEVFAKAETVPEGKPRQNPVPFLGLFLFGVSLVATCLVALA